MGLFEETTEEEMYQIATSQPLERKVELAIALIQTYEGLALQLSQGGYYVCFSGGKDSIVMAKLFEMAGVKYQLHYNNVTIDPPELVRFIKREYPAAIWHSQGKPLPFSMADSGYGPPTRLSRWCCELYKERGGMGQAKAIGVRASESKRRKGMWLPIRKGKKPGDGDGFFVCPILYWTDSDVWKFIRNNGMNYCELYDQGFTRLGCIGCPMGRRQREDFKRWPGYEKLWRRGFQRWWDKYRGVPRNDGSKRAIEKFKSLEDAFQWWISNGPYEGEQADCQLDLW